jgi:hypothetical protein
MENLVKIVDIVKEYTKDVHIDYDRGTVLLFLQEKFLQDFLVKIDKTPYDIMFKLPIDGKLICIVLGYEPILELMDEFDDD